MLLEGYGELRRVGLDCEQCDDERRAYLGCGREPVLDGRVFQAWIYPLIARTAADVEVLACERYAFANLGEVWRHWSFVWPVCPRWYLTNASAAARAVVDRVVVLDKYLRLGAPDRVSEGLLTPIAEDLWWRVHVYLDHLDRVDRERNRAED